MAHLNRDIEGFLHLIRDNPTLMPPAPTLFTLDLVHQRVCHEQHTCLGCGQPATTALLAHTPIGNRWLDACPTCYNLIRNT